MLITRNDIQCIGDEDTLLHFLEEKLNLPIPEGLTLEDITTKFSNFALGLSGSVANQVLDCQELSVSLGESSGIFLIRFSNESGYAEALRALAEGLGRLRRNPVNLRFICMNEYFQPFAIAYFNDSVSGDWHTAVLNILTWTQENTHIHTSSEHELPTGFFADESSVGIDDVSNEKIECDKEDNSIEESVFPSKPKDDIELSLPKDNGDPFQSPLVESVSSNGLLTKLETIGTGLGMLEDIHSGITTAYDRAFIIDGGTRERLLAKDPNSIKLIKRLPRINRKWTCQLKHLIWILSSYVRQWPWSTQEANRKPSVFLKKHIPRFMNI